MTADVKGLEFYVSSQKALPEIERFEAGIDRVTTALEGSAKSIEAFDERLDRLGRNRGGDGLSETARSTKQVSAAVQELLAIKKREMELDQQRAELQAKSAKARAAAAAKAREQALAERKAREEAIARAREQALAERRDRAIQELAREERAVRLARAERERYRLTIEAEAAARRAGLATGSAEYQDFVRRTVAVRQLAAAKELAEKRQTTFGAGLGKLGITAGGVLRTLTQLTAGFGAIYAVRSAVTTITETEDRLRILQSVSGATAEELNRLSAAANTLSLNSRFSFSDGTQALINLAKAGATASEAVEALPGVSNLARAGLLSLDDAVDTVVQTMSQFGLEIESSTRIGDVLVKAADATTSSVSSQADSLRKVGPVGREFGLSLETVTAAIAQMQQAGVQARVAGTGLAAIFKQLADPVNGPAGAAEALARLNLSFDDVHPRNFTAALDRLAGAGLTLQDATALVGTEFDYLLTTLVRNRDEVQRLEGALNSAAGDAAAKAAATVGTLGDAFADLSNSWDNLARSVGEGGVSESLKAVTKAGADALKVLSGDAEAMEKAGEAGFFLAGAAKGAAVAVAAIVAFNTIRSITSLAVAARGAGASLGALATVARANPLGVVAAAAAAAGAAVLVFGNQTSQAQRQLAEFRREADKAKGIADTFQALRLAALQGNADAAQGLVEKTKEQLIELQQLANRGVDSVSFDRVIGAAQQQFPELIGRLLTLREKLDAAQSGSILRTKEEQAEVERLKRELFFLSQEFEDVGIRFQAIGTGSPLAGFKDDIAGLQIETKGAIGLFDRFLGVLTGDADAARKALEAAAKASKDLQDGGVGGKDASEAAAPERARTDALQEFLKEKQREAEIDSLSEDRQRRARLLQEATNAAIASGKKLRFEDLAVLEAIARLQDKNATKKTDESRAKAIQKVIEGLENENELLEVQGAARDALQKRQEVLAALQAAKVDTASDEYQRALDLLDVYEQLALAEEKRGQAGRRVRGNFQEETIRRLEQEEKAIRLAGIERENYLRTIEAENEARQAGLEIGSAEFNDYVKRRLALGRLADAQQRVVDTFQQMGDAGYSALERVIIDGEKARDVMDALFRDLQRIALRQTVGQGLSQLLTIAGTAVANAFAGSGTTTAGPDSPTGRAGITNQSSVYGGNRYLMSGGVIPAMSGTVVDEFSFYRRAGKTFSLAEGGKTTPEGVFPLAKDSRGRLGVIAADGGGGGSAPITMVFPGVRTAQDARAMRVTASQRIRAAKAADRSGRVGLRPPGL